LQREINALPASDGDRVLWPGQLEAELAEERRANGVPLPAAILETLAALPPRG
jgi:LDH2 family malate/lactate/ureidoglycolate dehydrogenase